MNWKDALDIAHIDVLSAVGRAEKAQGPEDLKLISTSLLLHRLKGFSGGRPAAAELAKRLSFPAPSPYDPTINALLTWFQEEMDRPQVRRFLSPEDHIALAQWATGTRSEPAGFFRLYWSQVDPGTNDPAIDHLERIVELLNTTLKEEDQGLSGLAQQMPRQLRSLYVNLRHDGWWMFQDHDGYASAAVLEQRRRLVRCITARKKPPLPLEQQ